MDIVDQSFNNRLSPLQAGLPRAKVVTERAFDHRVHHVGLPTLSKQTIETNPRNQIGSRSPFRVQQLTTLSHRRDQIVVSNGLTVKARVG